MHGKIIILINVIINIILITIISIIIEIKYNFFFPQPVLHLFPHSKISFEGSHYLATLCSFLKCIFQQLPQSRAARSGPVILVSLALCIHINKIKLAESGAKKNENILHTFVCLVVSLPAKRGTRELRSTYLYLTKATSH